MKFKTMISIILSLILLFSLLEKAEAVIAIKKSEDRKSLTIYSTYEEAESYVIREYKVQKGNLQDFVREERFQDQNEYKNWLSKNKISKKTGIEDIINDYVVETEDSSNKVWEATNDWNDDWEEKYGQWIEQKVSADFFKNNNIVVDCADVAYALRWIFSRINSLPMQVTVDGSKARFSNNSFRKAWINLSRNTDWKKDQVFMASLKYIFDITGTSTLDSDTVPVIINRKNLRPGLINFLGVHTQVFHKVNLEDEEVYPVWVFESTVPARARTLKSHVLSYGKNIRQFKIKTASNQNEDFSSMPIERFELFKFLTEQSIKKNWPKIAEFLIQDFVTKLLNRDEIIKEGYKICADGHCHEKSKDFDDWSTFSRDKRLVDDFDILKENYLHVVKIFSQYISESISHASEGLIPDWEEVIKIKEVNITPGKYTLQKIMDSFHKYYTIADPSYTPEERWGLSLETVENVNFDSILKKIDLRRKMIANANDETFYLDGQLKKYLAVLFSLCKEDAAYCQKINKLDSYTGGIKPETILKFVSDKRATLNERWGESSHQKRSKSFFLPSGIISEIKPGIFVTQHKIFSAITGKELLLNEEVLGVKLPEIYRVKVFPTSNNKKILLLKARTAPAHNYFVFDEQTFEIVPLKSKVRPEGGVELQGEFDIEDYISIDGRLLSYQFKYSTQTLQVYLYELNENNELVINDTIEIKSTDRSSVYLTLALVSSFKSELGQSEVNEGFFVQGYHSKTYSGFLRIIDGKLIYDDLKFANIQTSYDFTKYTNNNVSSLVQVVAAAGEGNIDFSWEVINLSERKLYKKVISVVPKCKESISFLDSKHFVCDIGKGIKNLYSFDVDTLEVNIQKIDDYIFNPKTRSFSLLINNSIYKLSNEKILLKYAFPKQLEESCSLVNENLVQCNSLKLKISDNESLERLYRSNFQLKLHYFSDLPDGQNNSILLPIRYLLLNYNANELISSHIWDFSFLPYLNNLGEFYSKIKTSVVAYNGANFLYYFSRIGEVDPENEMSSHVDIEDMSIDTRYQRLNQGYIFHFIPEI